MCSRISSIFIVLVLASACSAGTTHQVRQDAVVSGSQTAKAAGDAAREADAQDQTGLIYATSSAGPPAEETAALPGKPDEPVEVVELVLPEADVILLDGKPITEAELITWVRERRAAHPDLRITLDVAEGVPPARVGALTAKLQEAGTRDVEHNSKVETPTTAPTQPPPSEPATPTAPAQ